MYILTILYLVFTSKLVIPQDKIQEAYDSLCSGKIEKAEQLFLKAHATQQNFRAGIGLAFCYLLEGNNIKARDYYYKAVKESGTPQPYILAGSLMTATQIHNDSTLTELLLNDSENKKDGSINAIACENLGMDYLARNNISKAIEYFNRMGAVKEWSVVGPFENISQSGYDQEYPPEKEFNPEAEYNGKNNMPVHWFNINKFQLDDWIDFT